LSDLFTFFFYQILDYDWYGYAEDYGKDIPKHENHVYENLLCGDYTFDFSKHFHKVCWEKKVNAGLLSFSRVGLFGRFKRNTVMT